MAIAVLSAIEGGGRSRPLFLDLLDHRFPKGCRVGRPHQAGRLSCERPYPGAQLTLFEAQDGWQYSLGVTNLPVRTRGWRGQLAYIDAAHMVHARVEDAIRTGKDCGIGKFPSYDFAINSAWLAASLTAAALLSWLRLIALDGDLAPDQLPIAGLRSLYYLLGGDHATTIVH